MNADEQIKQLTEERDAAQKACAEMREALNAIGQCPACGGDGVIHPECEACLSGEPERCTCANEPAQACPVCEGNEKAIYDKVNHALSTDCGKGYYHERDIEPLVYALKEILEWQQSAEKEWLESVDISVPKAHCEDALAHWQKVKGEK